MDHIGISMDFTELIFLGRRRRMILQSHHVLTHKAWRHMPSPADAKGVAPEDKDKEITTPEAIR
jgi:hypothetical protein